jgi:hypothetical protein
MASAWLRSSLYLVCVLNESKACRFKGASVRPHASRALEEGTLRARMIINMLELLTRRCSSLNEYTTMSNQVIYSPELLEPVRHLCGWTKQTPPFNSIAKSLLLQAVQFNPSSDPPDRPPLSLPIISRKGTGCRLYELVFVFKIRMIHTT